MMRLDAHPDVIWWQSEEIAIPYRSPIDGRVHRYYPDFVVYKKNRKGLYETVMIEVKPLMQTRPPKRQKEVTKRYLNEVKTWGINSSKWSAAAKYCKERGWEFNIMTEKEILGK